MRLAGFLFDSYCADEFKNYYVPFLLLHVL